MLDNTNRAYGLLPDFEPTSSRVSAVGASQIELELLYSKYQLIPAMRADFMQDYSTSFEELGIPTAFGIDLLVQACLHRRCTIETMVGILKHHFMDDPSSAESPVQACADMILKAIQEDVVDWDEDREQIVFKYDITPETQEMIDRYQYPLPMIDEPRPVENNRDTGYRTIKGSIVLKKNHTEDDVCLDHINRVNAQKLKLNADVVRLIQNQWKNLDRMQPGETFADFRKRKKAFAKYDRVSREVVDAIQMQGNEFWMTHKYDKRGRTYAQGYHVNYQGNDWNKAVIEFAHQEPLNAE